MTRPIRKRQRGQKSRSTDRVNRDETIKDLDLPVEKTLNVKASADAQKQQMERWKIMQDTKTTTLK
jgi:hypothetical protein